jgi:hypothetical protein
VNRKKQNHGPGFFLKILPKMPPGRQGNKKGSTEASLKSFF